ncbi:MAG: hypothetical protein H7125_15975 [Proteobacteria bacterium]|nr:hypothetical protein [Burkholderiales bacterium]
MQIKSALFGHTVDTGISPRVSKLRAVTAGLCLLASIAASAPASAALTQNNYVNGFSDFTLNRPGQSGQSVQAGGFSGVFNGAAFISYCLELAQTFSFGTTYNSYASVPVASAPNTSPMGGAKASDLSRLMGSYFAGSFASTLTTTAMQLAIWEIVYETGPAYTVDAGGFEVTGGDAGSRALANTYLANLGSISAPLLALGSPDQQDFITVIPVPPSMALFAGGLLFGLWGVRRRTAV